jgi:2'-5' RNA ligase
MRKLGIDRNRQVHQAFERPTDRLFWAILPDDDARRRIVERTARLRATHGLTGRALLPEHLHVTLFHVGDSAEAPTDGAIEAVTDRARSVVMPKFKVVFDRAMSFRHGAFVLASDEGTIGLDVLHQRLTDAFLRRPAPARAYTPHVTMLRDARIVPEEDIEPISWTASEMVLVHSELGRTRHNRVARVPLG